MPKTVALVLEMILNRSISNIDVREAIEEVMKTNISSENKDLILDTLVKKRPVLYKRWYIEITTGITRLNFIPD